MKTGPHYENCIPLFQNHLGHPKPIYFLLLFLF